MIDNATELEAAGLLAEMEPPFGAAAQACNAPLRDAMAQMTATVAAVRSWRDGHESQAAPVIVPVARRPLRLWVGVGAAAAAAVVLVALVLAGVFSRGAGGDSRKLADELAWTLQASQTPFADQSIRMEFQSQRDGGLGGPGMAAYGSEKGRGDGTLPAGSDLSQPPELTPFIQQFAFAFGIPQRLAGGWEFIRGRGVSDRRVQLIYRLRDRLLFVFISPAGGGDLGFRSIYVGGRKMIAGRRGGLAIAFEGAQADLNIYNSIARNFTAAKGNNP